MNDENAPVFDPNEATKFISERTGLSENIVEQVLEMEFEYMKHIGLV